MNNTKPNNTKPNTTKPNTITQDQLIRDIFLLYEKHGESGLPKARMLLAKYTHQEVTAFTEVADCDTRLKVANEADEEAEQHTEEDTRNAIREFATRIREEVNARGIVVYNCSAGT